MIKNVSKLRGRSYSHSFPEKVKSNSVTLKYMPSHAHWYLTVVFLTLHGRAGSNGIDIEASRHHTVSVSKVSTGDGMVHFYRYSWIPGLVHPLHLLYSDYYFLPNIISVLA